MSPESVKEWITRGKKGYFFADPEMSATQNHQFNDELLQKQKEFASLIYIQKDLWRDL